MACGSTLHMSFIQAMGVREECHGLCKVFVTLHAMHVFQTFIAMR